MADTGELIHADPYTLIVGENVRVAGKPDPVLVESIRQRGVLEPIVAYRRDDGELVVVHGQRRTIAAVQAGVPDVPVWVRDEPLEQDRLVDQVVENDHRAALADTDRLGAYEQLSALGVSAAQIAKRTASPRARVDAALKVAGSEAARAVAAAHGLTIEQAVGIAEFEHRPEVVKRLTTAAASGQHFDYEVQAARDAEQEQAACDLKTAELTAAGVPVYDRIPKGARWLDGLTNVVDGKAVDEDGHAQCPGHGAVVTADRQWARDAGEDDPGVVVVSVDYVCTDPAAHGRTVPGADPAGRSGDAFSEAAGDPDREAREEAEREKRREVIANNKAWRSAQTVRRDWLRKLAARKTPPKTGAAFVAGQLAWGAWELTKALSDSQKLGHELLGLTPPTAAASASARPLQRDRAVAEHLADATEARATLVALVLVLAAIEENAAPDGWRYPSKAVGRYLLWLQDNGYELSPVECLAAGLDAPPDGAG